MTKRINKHQQKPSKDSPQNIPVPEEVANLTARLNAAEEKIATLTTALNNIRPDQA